jgi:hypothetical protein
VQAAAENPILQDQQAKACRRKLRK